MAVLMLACVVVVAVSRVTVFVFSTHVLFFVEGVVLASLDARVGLYRLARIFINLVRRISFRCIHLTSLSTHAVWPNWRTHRQSVRNISPEKGKRSRIALKGWFGGTATVVFCGEDVSMQ